MNNSMTPTAAAMAAERAAQEAARRAAQEAARRAAQEAARRAAERTMIFSQIGVLNDRIQSAEACITSLQNQIQSVSEKTSNWSHVFQMCTESPITSRIVLKKHFRGEIAERLQVALPKETNKMNAIGQKANKTTDTGCEQERKLQSRIESLNTQILMLQTRVAQL